METVAPGFHRLYIRAKNANGVWSQLYSQPVYKLSSAATAPLANITRIEYFINTDPGYGNATAIPFTPNTTIEDILFEVNVTGLPETTHRIFIRAKDANGRWSQLYNSSFEVCHKPPTIAREATDKQATSFTANWDLVAGATNYLLDVSTDNFNTFIPGHQAKSVLATFSSVTGLTQGTTYQYRVRAVNVCASVYSNVITLTTPVATPSSQPSGFVGVNATESSFTISFNHASGPPTGYLVIRRTGASPTFVPQNNVNYEKDDPVGDGVVAYKGPNNIFVESGMPSGNVWHYDIFSYNQIGNLITYRTASPLEGSYYTKAIEPTAQPTALNFQSVTSTSYTVNFTAASGTPEGYIVFRRTGGAPTFVPVDGTTYTVNTNYGDSRAVYIGPNSNFPESGLTQLTTYHYAVYAYNGSGQPINYRTTGPLTGNVTTALQEPSAQPTNLTFSNIGPSSVTGNFTPATGSPSGYLVLRKAGSRPNYEPVYNTPYNPGQEVASGEFVVQFGPGTNFTDNGLAASTTYHYAIYSYNQSGGLISYRIVQPLENSVTTFTAEPGAQPSSLVFSNITTSAMRVTFTAANPAPAGYFAIRKAGSAPTFRPADGQDYALGPQGDAEVVHKGTALFFDNAGLQPGIVYHYIVFSLNGSGVATNYNITVTASNAGSKITVPGKPNVLTATNVQQTAFTARWEAVTGAASYRLDVSDNNFVSTLPAFSNLTVSGTSRLVDGLQPGIVYKYRVRAVNESGTSVDSDEMQQITIPATPVLLPATDPEQTSMTVSWNPVTGATGYYLDVSLDDFSTFATGFNNTLVTAPPVNVTGLLPGRTYRFRVRSTNSAGTSPNSNPPGQQLLKPATPVALDVSSRNPSGFVSQWNKAEGATEYRLDVTLASDNFSPSLANYNNKLVIGNQDVIQEIVTGLTPNTAYRYRVRAVNATGTSPSSNVINVLTQEQGTGVTLQLSALQYNSTTKAIGTTNEKASVEIITGTGPYNVKFFHRGISRSNWTQGTVVAVSGGTVYEGTLTTAMTDEFGVEFYFEVSDATFTVRSTSVGQLYKLVPSEGIKIPFTRFGGAKKDYELFSIPYDLGQNRNIGIIFDEMGAYDKSRWRLMQYRSSDDSNVDFNAGITNIDIGRGYWFNQREKKDISFTGGTTVQRTKDNPFEMTLNSGWNQIGNPFPFDIPWSRVLAENNNPSQIGELKVFDPNVVDLVSGNILKVWQGGFVFNGTGSNVTLRLPVTLSPSSGGRDKSDPERISGLDLTRAEWYFPIQLKQNGREKLTGFGMHPKASESYDWYDDIVPPRWGPVLEMYVPRPEFIVSRFARDIIPTLQEYTWDMILESEEKEEITLTWDNSNLRYADVQLIMTHDEQKTFVDMKQSSRYSFKPSGRDKFTIQFANGREVQLRETLIGMPYPNPMRDVTQIPVGVSDDQSSVEVDIVDSFGRVTYHVSSGNLDRGIHLLTWDGGDKQGERVANGLYLVRVKMGGSTFVRRLIKN
jgi:hypothetical protein